MESNQFGQGRDEEEARGLYEHLLSAWNARSAAGFDGSSAEMAEALKSTQ